MKPSPAEPNHFASKRRAMRKPPGAIQGLDTWLSSLAGLLFLAALLFSLDSYFVRPVRELNRLPGVTMFGYPVRSPQVAQDVLEIQFRETQVAAEHLQTAQQFQNLRGITFQSCTLSREAISQLKNLPQLEGLHFVGCEMNVQEFVSQSADSLSLKHVGFDEMKIQSGDFRDLEHWSELRWLSLRQSYVEGEEIRDIAKAPSIEHLTLSGTEISADKVAAIGEADVFRSLYVDGTEITDSHISQLCKCRRLRRLDLSETQVSASVISDLEWSPSLKTVYAWKSPLGAEFHEKHLSNGCVIHGSRELSE